MSFDRAVRDMVAAEIAPGLRRHAAFAQLQGNGAADCRQRDGQHGHARMLLEAQDFVSRHRSHCRCGHRGCASGAA